MQHFDLTIIGTGSGNSILDDRYAGMRVAICEQGTFGGTCLNVGCIPTKMFVYAAEVAATVRDAARFGVDAHVDGVRWGDIVSRVFGRIDPIALGGERYRRSSPNVTVFDGHTRFGPTRPDGRYVLRTADGTEFTSDKVVVAAGAQELDRGVLGDVLADGLEDDAHPALPELPHEAVLADALADHLERPERADPRWPPPILPHRGGARSRPPRPPTRQPLGDGDAAPLWRSWGGGRGGEVFRRGATCS